MIRGQYNLTHFVNEINLSSFHLGLQAFTTSKTFQSWTARFDPYRPFKKKDQTAFELRCTSQNFYPETIRFKSYSPLKYFIQVSTKSSILFSIFIKSCIFFSIYTILNKFESGAIRVDPYCPFLKNDQFLSKAHTYGSNYLVFPNISRNFRSRYHTVLIILSFQELYINFDQKLFFLLQIFLKNTNQE